MNKKIMVLGCVLFLLFALEGSAKMLMQEEFTEIPQGWTVTTSAAETNATVTASPQEPGLLLRYDTTQGGGGGGGGG